MSFELLRSIPVEQEVMFPQSQEPQVVEQESFADFTAFNQAPEVKGPEVKLNEKSEAIPQDKGMKKSKSDVIPKQERPETQKPHS